MASKREPLDKWTTREKLALFSACVKHETFLSISEVLKPFGEPNRPADWFSPENCAIQYEALVANEISERQERRSKSKKLLETPEEAISQKLLVGKQKQAGLKMILAHEKAEYQELGKDLSFLQSTNASKDQLDIWDQEINKKEQKKEQNAVTHEQWLKEWEVRKQNVERVSTVKPSPVIGQKRKISEAVETAPETENTFILVQKEPNKHALPHIRDRYIGLDTNTSPIVANSLNLLSDEKMSPGLQLLICAARYVEQESAKENTSQNVNTKNILDEINLPSLNMSDSATSSFIQDGFLSMLENNTGLELKKFAGNGTEVKRFITK